MNAAASPLTRVAQFLEFIKFSHTIFALPFALIAMLVAARGLPAWSTAGWILLCMVTARTAAMSFNRWVDWDFDRLNPRTLQRSTLASRRSAWVVMLVCLGTFVWATRQINVLCFQLCPLAIAMILGYSLTKRFTAYSHAFLGLALAAAPMGAWAAVTGTLSNPAPWVMALAVWSWVFGFDLIYGILDLEFDREIGLNSFPSRHGISQTLLLTRLLHLLTLLALLGFGWLAGLHWPYWISWGVTCGALVYEQYLCQDRDVRRINQAFFHMNALVSVSLLIGTALSL